LNKAYEILQYECMVEDENDYHLWRYLPY
jgi:hypothetical protein